MDKINEGRLTFELKERIPLEERSEDISTIRNVEVIPEIEMVAEYASYRIRGFLIFTGEYETKRVDDVNQPYLLDKSVHYNKKQVRTIHYRIPVDISIPADRVDEEGIVMEITSLDYELVEPYHLLVITSVDLIGLRNEVGMVNEVEKNAHWDRVDQYEYQAVDLDEEKEEKGQAFDFADEEEEQRTELLIEAYPVSEREDHPSSPLGEAEEPHDLTEEQDDRPELEVENEAEALEKREEENEELADAELSQEDEETFAYVEEEREPEVKVSISQKPASRSQEIEDFSSPDAHSEHGDSVQNNSARFLSQFLKNKEESKTQIKICLVQPGESLEEIANRYSVSQDEILSFNRLSYGSNIGGKVLKIPVRKAK